MTPIIRTAKATDVAAVLELWRRAEAEPTHTDNADSLLQLIGHDPQALVVAEDVGVLVGMVIAAWDGWRGSVYRLAVVPSHRRRGLGRSLLAEAEQRLREAGASRLQAIVVEGDARATGFWQSSDWERQAKRLR